MSPPVALEVGRRPVHVLRPRGPLAEQLVKVEVEVEVEVEVVVEVVVVEVVVVVGG